jgi:lipopolysaccharide export system permease protein
MVAPRLLWRYILRETLLHALLGLAVIALLLLVQNALRFLEELVGAGVGLGGIGRLLVAIIPSYLSYAIPTALVFGVLLTFGRMAQDGEMVALRAAGIGLAGLLPPVLALGLLGSGIAAYVLAEQEPRSQHALRSLVRELGKAVRFVEPGQFQPIGRSVLYVHARGGEACPLEGVLIGNFESSERPYYITSQCAWVGGDAEGQLDFQLSEGSIHFAEGARERYRHIRFAQMQLSVDISGLVARRRARHFTTAELLALRPRLERGEPMRELGSSDARRAVDLELQRRAAFPLASLLLSLAAVPLGIRPLRSGRSAGALTAVAVMAVYWLLFSIGELAAQEGYVPTAAGMWTPNLVVLALGLRQLRRLHRPEA